MTHEQIFWVVLVVVCAGLLLVNWWHERRVNRSPMTTLHEQSNVRLVSLEAQLERHARDAQDKHRRRSA